MNDAINKENIAALKNRIDSRLNNYLCDMKPDHDDSITGFNEAWDIVRKAFDEYDAISTPIPLTPSDEIENLIALHDEISLSGVPLRQRTQITPSDEMVAAALQGFDTGVGDPNDYRRRMKAALTTALNLIGGKK